MRRDVVAGLRQRGDALPGGMGHTRDLWHCLRPDFFLQDSADRRAAGAPAPAGGRFSLRDPGTARCCGGRPSCSFLLVVCAWVALPLACDFAVRQNRWLADHDADSLLRAVQSSVPRIDVRVVDGRATWSQTDDDEDTGAASCAANPANGGGEHDCAPRVEFPRSFYQLFEDSASKVDVISTYVFDTGMAATLRWLDPAWADDSYSFHVATPVEFIEADVVEA